MRLDSVPRALRDRLGEDATAGLVELFNRQQDVMTDAIVRAVVQALEPRFQAIEARLDQCATKADLAAFATKAEMTFATKADLERFATKADLERFATKADLEGFATKSDLAGFVTKGTLVGWLFAFWVLQLATTLAYLNLASRG